MADIFAFYDCSLDAPADQADMVTLWERSWRNRGWNPRLITARHARRSKFYVRHKNKAELIPLLALHAVGGGVLVPLRVMNFSLTEWMPAGRVSQCPHGIVTGTRGALEKYLRRPGRRGYKFSYCRSFGLPGWEKALLVRFSNPEEALNCGRSL
jgi:hypothetical protein